MKKGNCVHTSSKLFYANFLPLTTHVDLKIEFKKILDNRFHPGPFIPSTTCLLYKQV